MGGMALIMGVYWVFHRSSRGWVMPWFTKLQRLSAAYMAFSHGRNDAQKPMGVLAMALALHFGWKTVPVAILLGGLFLVALRALLAILG